MGLKESGEATEWQEIGRDDNGVSWIAYPDETMERASHALVGDDGGVWVIDPVDVEGLDDLLADFGEVAGVVVLLDRHKRDSAAVANRHDVSVWVPEFMDDVAEELDAPTERFRYELGESGYIVHTVVDSSFWQEALLYHETHRILVVPESLGAAEYFLTSKEELGVHPMKRLTPPRILTRFDAEQVRVGHGKGIYAGAAPAIREAVERSRTGTPALMAKTVRGFLPF